MKAILKFFCTNGILAIPLMFWFEANYIKCFLTGTAIGLLSLTIDTILNHVLKLSRR